MKSKISFFNKTIFKKNVTLYWPIWGMYTIFLVFVQPVMFWSRCYNSRFYDEYSYVNKLEDLIEVIYLDVHVYFIAYMALISGVALFQYLYKHKSASMIHAFPVDRTQLFGTNVISGISFLAVPQTISCVLLAIVALCNGVNEIHYIVYWWLLALGTDIVAFAVITFSAMFTGHAIALPVIALVINYFSYLVYYLVYVIVSLFSFGVNDLGGKTVQIVRLLSPSECFGDNVGIYEVYDMLGEVTGVKVYGVEILLVYLVVAAVLYALAYLTYKKRHVEQAGEFITVAWIKPIVRFGIALAGGIFFGIFMREFLRSIGIPCGLALFVLLLLGFGGICFFIADMLLNKSFHVFKKKNWMHCGICLVVLLVTFFGILGVGRLYESYQPDLEEIQTASVDWGYELSYEGEEAAKVLEIHKAILANREICMAEAEKYGYYEYEYVSIRYQLKNGDYIRRSYELPTGYKEIELILDQIVEYEMDPDQYLSYIFVDNYENIEKFYSGWFEGQYKTDSENYTYKTVDFTVEQAKEIFDAVIADAKAGTLMKYNVHSMWARDHKDYKYSEAYIMLEFENPNKADVSHYADNTYYYNGGIHTEEYYDETWYSASFNIGPDCENIINKLIEFDVIESVDDIWWGEIGE